MPAPLRRHRRWPVAFAVVALLLAATVSWAHVGSWSPASSTRATSAVASAVVPSTARPVGLGHVSALPTSVLHPDLASTPVTEVSFHDTGLSASVTDTPEQDVDTADVTPHGRGPPAA